MRETIPAALAGERVDRVVSMLTGLPRTTAARLVAEGAVRVDAGPVALRSHRVGEGNLLEVDLPPDRPSLLPAGDDSISLAVVYADDQVVVVDKPAGLVVHPGAGHLGGTLVNALLAHYPDLTGAGDPDRPGIVHRLDRGTSGLLVVARTPEAYESLVAQMAQRSVERSYRALAWGHVDADSGLIDAPVGRSRRDPTRMAVSRRGREARTAYSVLTRYVSPVVATLLECRLETGRTHQVRVHLAAIGHSLVGDARYGGARSTLVLGRPFLHAHRLAFDHPGSGERVEWSSPLPVELSSLLATLSSATARQSDVPGH